MVQPAAELIYRTALTGFLRSEQMSQSNKISTINSHCPWSGKPVSPDATTVYHNQLVGFCNPGCRDQFQKACDHFDQSLKQLTQQQLSTDKSISPIPISQRYQRRQFAFNGWWDIENIKFKVYTIHGTRHHTIEEGLIDHSKNFVDMHLPNCLIEESPHHGCGFIIIHQGEVADWLLVHWWVDQDICLHFLAQKLPDSPVFISAEARRFYACVWEQVVINHEKNAWVRLLQSTQPRFEKYWNDILPDGMY